MGEEFSRWPDEEARVKYVAGKQQPPFAGAIAPQCPMHAKDDGEKDEKAIFDEEHCLLLGGRGRVGKALRQESAELAGTGFVQVTGIVVELREIEAGKLAGIIKRQ